MDPKDFIAEAGTAFSLKSRPTRLDMFADKRAARDLIRFEAKQIEGLSHALYGEAAQSLLIVLQGMDTSGKDGTTSAIFSRTPPLNIKVAAFKKPTPKELAHDYLWRVHNVCPGKGEVTVFNRSHYEDVLVVKVRSFAPADAIERRYGEINSFEKHLVDNGTTILKFMLNISHEVQGTRLRERLVERHKFWKFNPGDLDDRKLWPDFMDAYETMVERTSTDFAPWYVIPSDHRATRGAIVSSIVRQTLQKINPQYPEAKYKPEDFPDI
ncbi:MAG: polyphosphate kinase 2 family protein [Acidimicrobiales bacterium]|nr:polyphosphate kinase 2 family protein [Hyphomonadaceae bacterium]RZV43824.1 MAG: polyphosphate kinase 2 family protein [Acidimicrobiales bacterium]